MCVANVKCFLFLRRMAHSKMFKRKRKKETKTLHSFSMRKYFMGEKFTVHNFCHALLLPLLLAHQNSGDDKFKSIHLLNVCVQISLSLPQAGQYSAYEQLGTADSQ